MTTEPTRRSLDDLVRSTPDLVSLLYNDTSGPHSRTNATLSPVPTEVTNWRDEQQAWRETAVLFDQSHHMPQLFLSGPDALALLSRIGVNSFKGFVPGKAKQFVGCTPAGHVIGDCILYYNGEQDFELVSGMPLLNWVHYQAEVSGLDVSVERENPTSTNPNGRRVKFRFGMDGPNAAAIFAAVVEGEPPEIPFFNIRPVRIAGRDVLALRHGMAGHKGVEISGAYDDGPAVREALLKAGAEYGLKQGGTKTYFSSIYESGYIGYPLPGIYTDERLRAYREWLPADTWEARFQLGGSFRSKNIEDYYFTPWDLGYDRITKFDHDFIGREALEKLAANPPGKKVTLVWNKDDVMTIMRSWFEPGLPFKYIELPTADYCMPLQDVVVDQTGKQVGRSTFAGYSANERDFLSLATVDTAFSEPGTELVLTWGEADGGSRKPKVERHRQFDVRVTVAAAPYAKFVQATRHDALATAEAVATTQ